jgi:hypothetical protein
MRNKLNVVLAAIALSIVTTAYGLCYLEKIANCAKSGDNLGSVNNIILPSGASTGPATLYASENAWMVNTYSVARGGYSETPFNSVCDSTIPVTFSSEAGTASPGGGFLCHYVITGSGSTGTCHSYEFANNIWNVNYSVASQHAADSGSLCN